MGKKYSITELTLAPAMIKDVFASHPMCEESDQKKLQESTFISLMKRPAGREETPYCYCPVYIQNDVDGFEVKISGRNQKPDLEEALRNDTPEFLKIKTAFMRMKDANFFKEVFYEGLHK